jgi:hypothetical protein
MIWFYSEKLNDHFAYDEHVKRTRKRRVFEVIYPDDKIQRIMLTVPGPNWKILINSYYHDILYLRPIHIQVSFRIQSVQGYHILVLIITKKKQLILTSHKKLILNKYNGGKKIYWNTSIYLGDLLGSSQDWFENAVFSKNFLEDKRHLKEHQKQFWGNIMVKKSFYGVSIVGDFFQILVKIQRVGKLSSG